MKIRLSTQGMSLNVEVPETKAIMVYRGLAEKLLIHACAQEAQMPKTVLQPKIVVNPPMPPETIKQHIEAETQENPTLPETEEEPENEGYTGFMKIRCSKCGKERTFCSKSPLTYFKCMECGTKTELAGLAKLYADCRCGRNSYYFTNIEDAEIDVKCIDCETTIKTEWDVAKKCYRTVKEGDQ